MLMMLKHVVRQASAVIRENIAKPLAGTVVGQTFGLAKRSDKWPTARKHWLAQQPTCEACGGTTLLQVHHVDPFADDPAKELDPTNLITVCMGKSECHLRIAHGDNFKYYNPNVRADAATVLADPSKFEAVAAKAMANRVHSALASS